MKLKPTLYRRYLLTVLLVIFAFNYVDRLALGLVLQDIKVDLSLSDTQLGFLSGIAFFLFYAVMGIPIARWADRGNRVTIITVSTALWSAAVALCGAAGSFLQLMLIRICVAVGEAGCQPPAHSLMADYFTRVERPRAFAIYMLGFPLSAVIGFFLAGWLNEIYGWRMMFLLLGLPGVGLAAVAWLTLTEPRREKPTLETAGLLTGAARASQPETVAVSPAQPSLKEVCVTLWANTTFRHLVIFYAVLNVFGSGVSQWQPAFFIRSHGMQTAELGAWFALTWGGGGFLGTYLGGEWASRRASHNEPLQLKGMALMYCVFAVLSAGIYLSPNVYLALALKGVGVMGVTAIAGPFFAMIQTLVSERMRAMAIAFLFLVANLVGWGLGPFVAGALSDVLRPLFEEESLRYTLIMLSPGYLFCAWHLWRASKTVTGDLEAVQRVDPDHEGRDKAAEMNESARTSIA